MQFWIRLEGSVFLGTHRGNLLLRKLTQNLSLLGCNNKVKSRSSSLFLGSLLIHLLMDDGYGTIFISTLLVLYVPARNQKASSTSSLKDKWRVKREGRRLRLSWGYKLRTSVGEAGFYELVFTIGHKIKYSN